MRRQRIVDSLMFAVSPYKSTIDYNDLSAQALKQSKEPAQKQATKQTAGPKPGSSIQRPASSVPKQASDRAAGRETTYQKFMARRESNQVTEATRQAQAKGQERVGAGKAAAANQLAPRDPNRVMEQIPVRQS